MYVVAHSLILFLPGLFLCGLLGVRAGRGVTLVSFALSYSIIAILVEIAKRLTLTTGVALGIWVTLCAVLAGLWWLTRRRRANKPDHFDKAHLPVVAGICLGIVAANALYHLWAGTYLEIPADVLIHMEYLRSTLQDLADGGIARNVRLGVWSDPPNDAWYYLFAGIATLTDTRFESALFQASIANTGVLLVVVYLASRQVFVRLDSHAEREIAALLATVLFFLHFGVNSFAYVRYYALAPTLLNFSMYLAAIFIVLRYADRRGIPCVWLLVLGVITAAAWLIHEQEALFIVLMSIGIGVAVSVQRHTGLLGGQQAPETASASVQCWQDNWQIPWIILTGLAIAGFAVVTVWSHLNLPRNPVFDNRLLSLQTLLPTSRDAWILNPAIQFYATISAFGLLVYIAFFASWFRVREHAFLIAGMLMPLGTVFNPFFADLFLRHSPSHNFWRFCYLIPVAWAAALLVIWAVRDIQSRRTGRMVVAVVVLTGTLAVIALPDMLGEDRSWNRLPSLTKTDPGNHPDHWEDIVDVVRGLDTGTQLHTDPVTGYVLNAMTGSKSMNYKFFRRKRSQLVARFFSRKRLEKIAGDVLVVNLRDGTPSRNGRLARHWPEDIMTVSAYYSPEFLAFVQSKPAIFKPLWSGDRVNLYRIHNPFAP